MTEVVTFGVLLYSRSRSVLVSILGAVGHESVVQPTCGFRNARRSEAPQSLSSSDCLPCRDGAHQEDESRGGGRMNNPVRFH
jgi:hypothetical protein